MNVVHGTGKPRIISSVEVIERLTVQSGSVDSVTTTTNSTSSTERYIETVDGNGDGIFAKITAINTNVITVDGWIGGDPLTGNVPSAGENVYIRGLVWDLPYCKRLVERFRIDAIQNKRANGTIRTKKKGWYYSCDLNYKTRISGNTLSSLEGLFNISESNFYFYPRKDNPFIYYKVNFPQNFILEFYQNNFHRSHGGVLIPLMGTERLTTIDLTTLPSSASLGYGDYYADGMYAGG